MGTCRTAWQIWGRLVNRSWHTSSALTPKVSILGDCSLTAVSISCSARRRLLPSTSPRCTCANMRVRSDITARFRCDCHFQMRLSSILGSHCGETRSGLRRPRCQHISKQIQWGMTPTPPKKVPEARSGMSESEPSFADCLSCGHDCVRVYIGIMRT